VITAWLAAAGAVEDAFATWRGIPMPGWCVVEAEGGRVRLVSPFVGLPPEPA
jgi:hypothetical protein